MAKSNFYGHTTFPDPFEFRSMNRKFQASQIPQYGLTTTTLYYSIYSYILHRKDSLKSIERAHVKLTEIDCLILCC